MSAPSERSVSAYPDDHPQGQFDRYFEGVWEPRWWRRLIGVVVPELVKITTYSTGEVTGELRQLHGVTEDGESVTLYPNGKGITGWRRVGCRRP